MKKFKKLFVLVGILFVATCLTACGSDETKDKEKDEVVDTNKNVEGDLVDLMAKLYAGIPEDELPMYLENIEVNSENVESFIGTKEVKYTDILASESMVGSTAYSVVLVRVSDDQDVDTAKKLILDNVNPRKWICVGIEKDEVIVKNRGNLVILIIIQENEFNTRQKISDAFDNLK